MTLQQTVSKITGLAVSKEDAMAYARDNFGILAAFLRKEDKETVKILEEGLNTIITLCSGVNDSRLDFIKGIGEGYINRSK